jgi:hypothetical protein
MNLNTPTTRMSIPFATPHGCQTAGAHTDTHRTADKQNELAIVLADCKRRCVSDASGQDAGCSLPLANFFCITFVLAEVKSQSRQ